MVKKKETVKRFRNFATIVYPDSVNFRSDFLEVITSTHVPCLVSPLHDKDINPYGEAKKPHYHIIFMFDGVKTVEQFKEISSLIDGVGCEIVNSTRGYARYLTHLDNPEKFQYKSFDVVALNGADYTELIALNSDKYKSIREMINFIKDNDIIYYSDLLLYCSEYNYDWYRCLCDNGSYVIHKFLQSSSYKSKVNNKSIFNKILKDNKEI